MAVLLALEAYELAALAAGAVAALYLQSPQGQQQAREAARATAEALRRAQSAAREGSVPRAPPTVTVCPQTQDVAKQDEDETKPCPVCKTGRVAASEPRPAYLGPPPRAPLDAEANPPLNAFQPTSRRLKGARIWRRPDGSYIHRDTLHLGMAAELETYDRRGRHMGSVCPNCGSPRKGPNPAYSIDT